MCLRQASSLFESIVYYFFFSVLLLVTLSDNQWKSMYLLRIRLTVSFTVRSISESTWQCWFMRAAGRLPIDIKSRMKRAERTCILLTTSVKRKTMISNDFPTVLKVHEFLKHLEYPLFLASKSWRLKLIFAIVPSFYTDMLISRRTRKSNRSTFAISRPRFLTFYIQILPLFSFHLTRYLGQTLAAVCYRRSIRP